MTVAYEDCYVVYLRDDPGPDGMPREYEIESYPSYEEAERVCRQYQGAERNCFIRYLGPAGGGD
jgi:hypothetical protein